MIETRVRIVSAKAGMAWVEPTESGGCTTCHSKDSCGISGLGRYFSGRRQPIAIACESPARPGEEMVLRLAESDLLRAGFLAYFLPALMAVLGAGLASTLYAFDAAGPLGALAGAAAGLLVARIFSRSPVSGPAAASVPPIPLTQGETP